MYQHFLYQNSIVDEMLRIAQYTFKTGQGVFSNNRLSKEKITNKLKTKHGISNLTKQPKVAGQWYAPTFQHPTKPTFSQPR